MRMRSTLLCAISWLCACSTDQPPPPSEDLAISMPDASVPADLAVPPDMTTPPLTQCGNIPVLGSQGLYTGAACLSCIATSCCTEGMACGSDSNCASLRSCQAACTTDVCASNCNVTYATGRSKSDTFNTCRQTKCNPSCNDLSCAGSVTWKTPPQSSYSMRFVLLNFSTRQVIANATVKVCPAGDATCASPLRMGTTDATGSVMLTVPVTASGLDGFLEVTEASLVPTMYFMSRTNNQRVWDSGALSVYGVPKTLFNTLIGAVGVTADAARGHLGFLTEDCGGNLVAGVSVTASTSDAQSTTAYSIGGVPSKTATATDASSFGFIANLPVGAAVITSKSGMTRLGTQNVLFRAGTLTTINTAPTP